MKITSETKLFLGIITFTVGIIALATGLLSRPPKPLSRPELIQPGVATAGNPSAATWLVEFSDFQCPACAAFSKTVDSLVQKYPNDLLVAYRHFPLPQHPESRDAALVSEAAKQQGKFWEMTSLLFTNQESLTEASYASFAADLKLNLSQFNADRGLATNTSRIEQDVSLGATLGVNATPTFYLNGIKLSLNMPQDLEKAVVDAINRAKTLQK